jgi:hypothetical protein
VGLTHLIRQRHQLGRDDVRFRIRGWPLELVNGEPVDAHFVSEEIDEIKPQVAPDLFAGFDPGQFPAGTLPALALTAAAYEIGDGIGEAVAMQLRQLVFEHGRNVADPAVLQKWRSTTVSRPRRRHRRPGRVDRWPLARRDRLTPFLYRRRRCSAPCSTFTESMEPWW